jgi:hypothetical protein
VAARFWVGGQAGATTDWSQANNWSTTSGGAGGAGVPTAADAVTFDAGAATDYNCSLTAASVCLSLTSVAAYVNTFSTNGQTLTISGSCTFDHAGPLTINSTVSLIVAGTFHIGTNITTFTGGGSLDLQITGGLDIDKDISASPLLNLTCAYDAKTTTVTNASTTDQFNGVLQVGSGGAGGTLHIDGPLCIKCDNANPLVINASTILNGAGSLYFNSGSQATVTFPAATIAGTVKVYLQKEGTATTTFQLSGTLNVSGNLYILNTEATNSYTFDSKDYDISCANFYCGSNVASTTTTITLGSSSFTGTYLGAGYNVGTLNINIGKAATATDWTNNGDFSWQSNATITYTNVAQVTFELRTPAGNLTSNGKYFPRLSLWVVQFTPLDTLYADYIIINSGPFSTNGQQIFLTTGISFSSGGLMTVNSLITITGDGDFSFGSSSVASDCSTGSIDMQGTGSLKLTRVTTGKFATIKCAYPGQTTTISNMGTGNGLYPGAGQLLTVNGGNLVVNDIFNINVNASSTPISIVAGSVITGTSYINLQYQSAGNATTTWPAFTSDGCGLYFVGGTGGTGIWTINLTGAQNLSSAGATGDFRVLTQTAAGTITFNSGNYAITCTNAIIGVNIALSTVNFNAGNSTFTMTTLNATSYTTGTALNYNIGNNAVTTDWEIKGNFTWNSNATVTYTNITQVTFTFTTNSATITTNAKALPVFVLNGPTKTYTMADAFTSSRLLVKPDTIFRFKSAVTSTVTNYIEGDMDGIDGHLSTINATTATSQALFTNPPLMNTFYLSIKDNVASNVVYSLLRNGNVDAGNDGTNWIFRNRRFFTTVAKVMP